MTMDRPASVGAAPSAIERALDRLAVDAELSEGVVLGERLGGERHPVHFLRAEERALRPRLLEDGAGARDRVALNFAAELGLGDEREHGRGVAQPRAIVGPRDALVALGVERLKRRAEGRWRRAPGRRASRAQPRAAPCRAAS